LRLWVLRDIAASSDWHDCTLAARGGNTESRAHGDLRRWRSERGLLYFHHALQSCRFQPGFDEIEGSNSASFICSTFTILIHVFDRWLKKQKRHGRHDKSVQGAFRNSLHGREPS
jgi:hypothetical protein